jgi:hypothetical protein
MRLPISCMKCRDAHDNKFILECTFVEICDDGKYELECSLGHKTTVILQQQKFEILFEIGAHAILDGYYREAVSSFAASLERFYEFSIRVFLKKASVSNVLFDECWKSVSNQSERQLGAFIFLWVVNLNSKPPLLPSKQVEFRNNVIHKGRIPTKEEAVLFGEAVLNLIRPNVLEIREHFSDQLMDVIHDYLHKLGMSINQTQLLCTSTIISLSQGDDVHLQAPLQHHLDKLRSGVL